MGKKTGDLSNNNATLVISEKDKSLNLNLSQSSINDQNINSQNSKGQLINRGKSFETNDQERLQMIEEINSLIQANQEYTQLFDGL